MNRAAPLAVTACCISAVFLFGCGHHKRQAPVTNAAYQQALADAKKAGIIVAAKDLAQPMPLASRNAAPVYAKLTTLLDSRPMSKEDTAAELQSRPLDHVHTPAELAAAASLLKRRSDVLALTHQAASRPQCVFDRNWAAQDSANIPFPELATIRECARFLATESLLMAYHGNTVAAVVNEALSFRLARHAGSDRTLISYAVETAINAITFAALQKIMVVSHGDPAVAKAIADSIDKNWRPAALQPSIRAEIAMDLSEVEFLCQHAKQGSSGSRDNTATADEMRNANGLYLLTTMRKMSDAVDLPYPEAHSRQTAIQAQIQKDMSVSHSFLPSDIHWNIDHMVAGILVPDPTGLVEKKARIIAIAHVTRAAAAVFEYKADHGAYPESLPDSTLNDPYDLKPLRYRREGTGFTIYSLGPTLHYDGNTSDPKVVAKESVFRYR